MAENHHKTNNTDLMWMKMALMAASRAEITEHAEGKPSVGCVIRRSRNKGPPAILSVGWNGFLPNTPEEEMEAIKGGSFKSNKQKDNILTAELGLHAEVNALQYCTEMQSWPLFIPLIFLATTAQSSLSLTKLGAFFTCSG